MFDLIKKDIITSMKTEGIKNIKYIFVFVISYLLFNSAHYYIAQVFISYLILANTFYCDYENNSRNFIKSMPTSSDDIVYSKYIMGLGTILVTTIICTIINQIFSVFSLRGVVLDDIYFGVDIFLIIISVILPLYFRFGYHKMRTLCGVISVFISTLCMSILSMVSDNVFYSSRPDHFISYATTSKIGNVIINFIENTSTKYLNLNTMTFITLIIFIISMYISLKIIKSKKSNY